MLVDAALPAQQIPSWITGARLYPLADASASLLRAFAPRGWKLAGDMAPSVAGAIMGDTLTTHDDPSFDSPAVRPGHDSGYSERQRKALDVLVENHGDPRR